MNGFLITYSNGKQGIVASTWFGDGPMLDKLGHDSLQMQNITKIEPINVDVKRTEDDRPLVYGGSRSRFSTREVTDAMEGRT